MESHDTKNWKCHWVTATHTHTGTHTPDSIFTAQEFFYLRKGWHSTRLAQDERDHIPDLDSSIDSKLPCDQDLSSLKKSFVILCLAYKYYISCIQNSKLKSLDNESNNEGIGVLFIYPSRRRVPNKDSLWSEAAFVVAVVVVFFILYLITPSRANNQSDWNNFYQ